MVGDVVVVGVVVVVPIQLPAPSHRSSAVMGFRSSQKTLAGLNLSTQAPSVHVPATWQSDAGGHATPAHGSVVVVVVVVVTVHLYRI